MKLFQKMWVLILVPLLIFSLAGCSLSSRTEEEDRQQLTDILDDIAQNLHPGTAGNSLTSVRLAADLTLWAANTKLDRQEVRQIMGQWLEAQSPQIRETFREQMEAIRGSFERIVTDGGADLLESAGIEKDFSNLSTRLKSIVGEILASGGLDQ